MSRTYNDMPIATCPHCEKEQQLDDYYDLDVGDSRECLHCEKEMHVVYRATTINIELSTDEDKQ
jgi:Zn ribbon nucleic-acid-binding protein